MGFGFVERRGSLQVTVSKGQVLWPPEACLEQTSPRGFKTPWILKHYPSSSRVASSTTGPI